MKSLPASRPLLRWFVPLLLGALSVLCARADDDATLPSNLGRGLRPLVAWQRAQPAGQTTQERRAALVKHINRRPLRTQVTTAGEVTVDVRLDGSVAADEVKKNLSALGLTIIGEHEARHADKRDGMVSARLPLDKATDAAKVPGVQSVLVAHRGRPRAGKVPGQGLAPLHADEVQAAGYTGSGITVGVLSDSYDQVSPHAANDVASGDLPTGVVVLQDDNDPSYDTDEGRAMLQIVHDVAPNAKLAFSTTGATQTTFAQAIRSLRTNTTAPCDVLVDDIGFSDEPFFSDSIVAEEVDEVVTSTAMAGKKVIYYSAAGNDGSASYAATFDPVSDADVRSGLGIGNLKVDQVPRSLTAGGWQNFKGADLGHGTKVVQKVTVMSGGSGVDSDAEIDFQWDDPFDASQITSDYNILVFDADGNYLPGDPNSSEDLPLSGIDNNYSTGEAIEYAELPINTDGSDTNYQIAITRASSRGSSPAARLRYFAYTDGSFYGKYIHTGLPTLFGHSGAANADGVGAYDVHDTSVPEGYNSLGPITLYFDANGNRLSTPVVRDQPTISTVDGVDTTFFPQPANENDSDGDGYPNFYGTSAAAPHAAAVAALLLQAGGGPGSLSAADMRALLESTATDHDLDPAYSAATLTSMDGTISLTLSANGDPSNNSAFDQDFFRATFTGPSGASLRKLAIDIGPANEVFDLTTATGYPFTVGELTTFPKTEVVGEVSDDAAGATGSKLSVLLTPGVMLSGSTLAFGVDRDIATGTDANTGGNSADLLAGSTVTARLILADGSKVKLSGTMANKTGHGYSPDVGYGLINAEAALQKLLGQ